MGPPNPAPGEFRYDILMEDADGRNLRLESTRDLNTARERLPALEQLSERPNGRCGSSGRSRT